MSAEEILELEAKFGIRLPDDYKLALLNPPDSLTDEEFCTNASDIILSNEGCRTKLGGVFPWLDHLWWIGDDGSGGFFFISALESPCQVYYYDHEVPAASFEDREMLKPCSFREWLDGFDG